MIFHRHHRHFRRVSIHSPYAPDSGSPTMIAYPPTTPPQPSEQAAAKANGRRYQIVFGSIFAGLTVLALALAALAPDLLPAASRTASANWRTVYESDLAAATAKDYKAWDLNQGCAFYTNGLAANAATNSDAAICAFTPAGAGGATKEGFYFELSLVPAAQIPVFQTAQLLVGDFTIQSGNTLTFEIDQSGRYALCENNCGVPGQGNLISGGTAAWHSDAFVANTIAVEVSPDHARETFFVNGQQVLTASLDMGAQPALAAGAPGGSGAIFTHATFSTGE
jgi:hypothetical protein